MPTGYKTNIIIMKYINTYQDTAAYNADTARAALPLSSVSNIQDGSGVKFTGKNVIMDKLSASVGDTVVFDKTANAIKVVKLDTLNRATLPANLVIMGVVFHRTENMAHVVAHNAAASAPWGAPYRVKVTGFDFATGGAFTVTVNTTTTAVITYTTSDTLTTIATSMMAALQAAGFTAAIGWSCTAYTAQNCIVVQQNWYTPNVTIFTITDLDSKVSKTILTGNYQTALSGIITPYGYIRMKCGINTSRAGCNYAKFILYYSASGQDLTGQTVASDSIIKESRFNANDNPLLVAYYGTYTAYMQDKMLLYPAHAGSIKDDTGKVSTAALAAVMYTDHDGIQKPAYPAAYNAFSYGIATAGYTTGFEAGNWYMESVRLTNILMKDISYGLAGITGANADPVNRSIFAAGGTLLSVTHYPWTSTEFSSYIAWFYYGYNGNLGNGIKHYANYVRPVTAFQLR